MKVAVLHLSDIHFKGTDDGVIPRIAGIASAVRAHSAHLDHVFVALTGDIAYSGARDEYELALQSLFRLRSAIVADRPDLPVSFVAVPGNHDCAFDQDQEIRDALLETIPAALDTIDPAGRRVAALLSVQDAFFDFESRLTGREPIPIGNRLYYERTFPVGEKAVRFQCHNTAWLSRLHEQQGQLAFPVRVAVSADSSLDPVALAVSLFHHPYNWLESSNGRSFKELVERTSDLVLTGHEHFHESYLKRTSQGAEVNYISGAVLQDADEADKSGFHVLVADTVSRTSRRITYAWHGELYQTEEATVDAPLPRNPLVASHGFDNITSFASFLSDPGGAFEHPRSAHLALRDVFVYPDVTRQPQPSEIVRDDPAKRLIAGNNLAAFIATHGRVVVIGELDCGKTSLAKALYQYLKDKMGVVPLLLNGKDLTGTLAEDLHRDCRRAFRDQYPESLQERYEQLERKNRVLILDDFHLCRYNRRGQKRLLDEAFLFASGVIVMVDDLFMVEHLAASSGDAEPFAGYEHLSIRPLGYRLRGQLITKWYYLGQESTGDENEVAAKISMAERTVTSMLGKNLLPSYPFTVLAILQGIEAASPVNTTSGSYGYLYEMLITMALAALGNRGSDLDTKYAYIAHLAFAFHQAERPSLSYTEINAATQDYFLRYRIRFSLDQMLEGLVEARVFNHVDGTYSFRYKYVYCYFVARYIRDHISNESEGLRAELRRLADRLYFSDFANIVIFYVYLTRDPELIGYLVACAQRVYANESPCDLESDVKFLNALYIDTKPLQLLPGNHVEHQEEDRERRDSDETDEPNLVRSEDGKDLVYSDALSEIVKINFAFKTLHVIGQVLRNFPGSLDGDVKVALASESYLLGLRTLKALLRLAEENLNELRLYFSQLIKEQRSVSSLMELAQEADTVVVYITMGCAYGIIKRISQAVGLETLSETYQELLDNLSPQTSVRLIDVSIHLDHFKISPVQEVSRLSHSLSKNRFAFAVLREMVANHLYLFPVKYQARQALGQACNIDTGGPRYLDNPSKMA